jgi:hypothetical protein
MWEPRRLTTIWALTACNRDSFTFYHNHALPAHIIATIYQSYLLPNVENIGILPHNLSQRSVTNLGQCYVVFSLLKCLFMTACRKMQFCLYCLYISPRLHSPCEPWRLFQFLNLDTVGRTPLIRDQPVARSLPIHSTTHAQNKRTQTSMPRVGFESTIPVFERAKTVHASDSAATVIGFYLYCSFIIKCSSGTQKSFSLEACVSASVYLGQVDATKTALYYKHYIRSCSLAWQCRHNCK